METEIENSWKELITSFISFHPTYHLVFEICLIISGLFLYFRRSYKPTEASVKLTKREEDELISEWVCEPLVPETWKSSPIVQQKFQRSINTSLGHLVKFADKENGEPLINFSSFNFFDLVGNEKIREAAIKGLRKYGVGSCGPRGFYGTFDAHLKLEEEIADFLKCEESVVYSYGFSTIASAIPAYSKRGDIIFADEGVSFAIQCGLLASRSRIKFFRHNDTDHLEELLKEVAEEDLKNPAKARITRKFIVIEGLYINHGDICPLSKIVELKYRYKVRIFLEESMSLYVLGKNGRGLTEHSNIDTNDIDLITGSLENSLASCGGFSVGSKFVVDHQRLSGQGYCFSASLPPLLACGASVALEIIRSDSGNQYRQRLALLCQQVNDMFINKSIDENDDQNNLCDYWLIEGCDISPIKHIRLKHDNNEDRLEEATQLAENYGVLLTVARYLKESEHKCPDPSIRITLNCALTDDEIVTLKTTLLKVGREMNLGYLNSSQT